MTQTAIGSQLPGVNGIPVSAHQLLSLLMPLPASFRHFHASHFSDFWKSG